MTGIICINKDEGITSFGVVAKVRKITGEKKAGHTGTLDPMATGVLPVMLGGATRLLNYLTDSDKGYRASFALGKTTDTLDVTGNVLTTSDVEADKSDVERELKGFTGRIQQVPPMYSAVSVDGKRLYELARQGIEVERQARCVEIKKLELIHADDKSHEYTIDVLCSKGTYIRTLIDDLGSRLGCGAVMTSLVRTYAMGFTLSDAVTVDSLQQLRDQNAGFESVLHSVDKILSGYDCVYVSPAQAIRFCNGGELDLVRIKKQLTNGIYRVYSPHGDFLGLGRCDAARSQLLCERVIRIT